MGRNDSRTRVAFLLAAVVIGLAGCRDATDRVAMRVQTVVRGMSLASEAERVAADRACALNVLITFSETFLADWLLSKKILTL